MFAAIETCPQALHAMGCTRVSTTVKINTRTDKDQRLEDKVASVQAQIWCGTSLAFAGDPRALPLSLQAVERGWLEAEPEQARRQFWLKPVWIAGIPQSDITNSEGLDAPSWLHRPGQL